MFTLGDPIMSYLPDSYLVRSGPGVSGVRRQMTDVRGQIKEVGSGNAEGGNTEGEKLGSEGQKEESRKIRG
jgi:hypothetical protein